MNPKLVLLEYGLNEKEADIYLALLQLGSGTTQDISYKTGIIRQTTYDSLHKLEDKGLVHQTILNKSTMYIPQKPNHILSLLDDLKTNIENSLVEFEKFSVVDTSIVSQQFRGLKGIKMLYDEFLDSKDTILAMQPSIPEKVLQEHFIQNFFQKRIEKQIPIKILRRTLKTNFQKSFATKPEQLREVRVSDYIPNLNYQTIIFNNTLVFIDDENLVGIKITHQLFVESQKQLFNYFWANAKEI